MRLDLLSLLAAGIGFALVELLWVLITGHRLFLSAGERFGYAFAALTALPALVVLLGLALRPSLASEPRSRVVRIVVAAVAAAVAGWGGQLLTEGRRVRELGVRPLLVSLFALTCGALFFFVLERGARIRKQGSAGSRKLWTLAALLVVVACLITDMTILPRGYPAFHVGLSLVALTAAALASRVWWLRAPPRFERAALAVFVLSCLAAPVTVKQLAAQPNASFAVSERSPWSAKLMRLASSTSAKREKPTAAQATAAPGSLGEGIDLRDADVLLITVDALRADMLLPYGGKGRTPELDALAKDSVVFERAYTPAPHTSYALTSLLTGKFMKPVVELPGAPTDHATLPDIVRRYGYRTAAFYPPAIFFVDGARFSTLSERSFGFEYEKQMYAPAMERVNQVKRYLAQAETGHPLFVWVHFFEPHEPYDPPKQFVREDSARGRYEGEVAQTDQAIGALVRTFRAARPSATVIVTADHGEEFGDHGGHYHGTTLYDEQARIPLLWSSPGKVSAGVVKTPVELVDVGTTLLSALGMPRDARMRGDDWGALLRAPDTKAPGFAFASVEDRHMATDGRYKALCSAHDEHCQLFDLQSDPRELKNLSLSREADVVRLRDALDDFLSSIPRNEALSVSEGVGFPAALARARLGAPGAGPDVIPLLGDARPGIRAAAARVLGELNVKSALPMLTRVRENDPDPVVRAEAAVASLWLSDLGVVDSVIALLDDGPASTSDGLMLPGRAALALASAKRIEAVTVLRALALDVKAQEIDRTHAVEALGELGGKEAVETLSQLLADVRLRPEVATALGRAGGKKAADALVRALAEERYQPARKALGRALVALKDARARGLVERFLGMETSMPDGIRMLLELGVLDVPSARGARVSVPGVREGAFTCQGESCVPGAGATLVLPGTSRGEERVTFLISDADPGAVLVVDGEALPIKAREDQVSVRRQAKSPHRFALEARGKLALVAVAITKSTPEIPPPPPEPWQAKEP